MEKLTPVELDMLLNYLYEKEIMPEVYDYLLNEEEDPFVPDEVWEPEWLGDR